MNWRDQALCAQVGGDVWFPEKGEPASAAKRICERCPVQAPCLDYALAHHEQYGIWGGLSYHQRLDRDAPVLAPQLESAREHERVITALPAIEAAQALGVSARTVQRWRSALRGAA